MSGFYWICRFDKFSLIYWEGIFAGFFLSGFFEEQIFLNFITHKESFQIYFKKAMNLETFLGLSSFFSLNQEKLSFEKLIFRAFKSRAFIFSLSWRAFNSRSFYFKLLSQELLFFIFQGDILLEKL